MSESDVERCVLSAAAALGADVFEARRWYHEESIATLDD